MCNPLAGRQQQITSSGLLVWFWFFFFSFCLKTYFQIQTLARQVCMVLTRTSVARGEAKAGRDWGCWHYNSHLIPVLPRMTTISCSQLALAAQSWNASSAELVTASAIYLVIKKWQITNIPKAPVCWGTKTPGTIFHLCLTQALPCSVSFPPPSSRSTLKAAPSSSPQLLLFTGIASLFTAECNFLENREFHLVNITPEIRYSSQSCLASYPLAKHSYMNFSAFYTS